METKETKRKSGVLLHITSLWGDYSCGSFGKAGREFVDFLKDCGFSLWQVLPFCLPDEFESPYSSYSVFSVNPYFIDLEPLCDVGLVTYDELKASKQETPYACEFKRLKEERFELLKKAASRYRGGSELDEFFAAHPDTDTFCHFMAKKATNGGKSFLEWTSDKEDKEVYETWRFICYVFVRQWKELKKYANDNGIEIVGDIPIYPQQDCAEVWAHPDQFQLDENKRARRVAGVPPDYFSEDGQLWGNPIYDWDKMKEDGYAWWRARMAFMCEFFDGIRIDHFRAFESYYSCDPDAKNARDGIWTKGPGMDFINAMKEVCRNNFLIAEDLGIITDEVKALVDESGFPGMRVLQFGFDGDPTSPHIPFNYEKNCIAYTGTHDNNTLLGYVFECDDATRRDMLSYCGFNGDYWNCKEAYDAIIRTLLESAADTVIIPLQDILLYGADTRMNTPGVKDGNWWWRVTKDQLSKVDRGYYRRMNRLFGRLHETPEKASGKK